MTGVYLFTLFPLQSSISDLSFGGGGGSSSNTGLIIFGIIVVVIIIVFVIIKLTKKSHGGGGGGGGGGGASASRGSAFSGLAFNRFAENLGLDSEQAKMLAFVFKTDEVVEPEKSINTPDLLDRHFRRTYRLLEQDSDNDSDTQYKLAVLFSTRNVLENSLIGSISSTRQLKDDITFTLHYRMYKINAKILNAKTEHLAVETPRNVLGTHIKIPKGTRLSVLFFTKNNKGFSFETRVIEHTTINGHQAMLLAHSDQVRFLSKRCFRRRPAVIACFMFLVYIEGEGKKKRFVVDKRVLTGQIADISVGGCSIKTTAPVQVGARFKIEYTQGDNKVSALGQVLRKNRTRGNNVIHIKFLKLTQESMNIINAFVYEYANE